ncbi:MAG: DEAD/DEAH box helicase [Opitutaceae bacterium]|nr:DEAD/DEAH box helicase [Cytophagales bacterium]
MKLYIHDKCMEQLFELPKTIQKKVLEFQKKFRDNSKSSAIHLEPISSFKDPLLRTARIDDKYRAIIKVPQTGDDNYLLWVDNHDEAMDWAKNKVFHWNENTQTAQIFNAPEPIVADYNKLQPAPATLFEKYTDEEIMSIGVPGQLMNLVRSVKDLNELGNSEKYLPVDAFENLFYLADGANYELLLAEINEGKSKSSDHEEQVNSINNKRNFIEVDDDMMAEIINGDFNKWQIFLHPSQRKLVESNFKGSVKVTGGAGTGKTVVALHRLKALSSLPVNGDNRKIVFTTFTNALTQNLIQLAEKLSIDLNNVLITNIDSLVRELAREHVLIDKSTRMLDSFNSKTSLELWDELLEDNLSEYDPFFLSSEYQSVILFNDIKTIDEYIKVSRIGRGKPISRKKKMDIWELFELYNKNKKQTGYIDRAELFNLVSAHNRTQEPKVYKYVIADEVQDLSNVELRFLRSLVEEKDNDLFLVGDPYQKIYSRKLNFTSAGIAVRGTRSKQLRINYRTSEEIKRLAITAVKGINYDDFDGESEKFNGYLSLFHGQAPTYDVFKTKDEEIDTVIQFINDLRNEGFKYSDIAVGGRTKEAIRDIKTKLHTLKIPYADRTTSLADNSDGVVLSTFHSLKGLEFKAVILVDVNNRTSPLYFQKLDEMEKLAKEDYYNSERSLLYVAITRAISVLKITGTGLKSDLVKL